LDYNTADGKEDIAMKLSALTCALLLIAGPLFPAPDDLETAYQNLKETTEAKKDAAEIKKVAAETYALAHAASTAAAPEAPDAKEAWTKRVAYAKEVEAYTEYALYAAAAQAQPATTVDLLATLEQQNPKSKYFAEGYGRYFVALNQTGAAAKVPAIAEKAVANFPANEDLLLVLADNAMSRKQSDRALGYARRLVTAVEKKPKPESMAAADWERKRTAALGRGHWIAGLVYFEKTQFYQADQELRAALPLIKGSDAMLGQALFNLGVADFQLGKQMGKKTLLLDAVKFSEQAANLGGPLGQQAAHNALVMKGEAERMR
jgi:hypothetical protein